ncbi:MAG: YdeI/OmpD-associated family protein [Acidimicrobiia bacterium]
MSRTPMVGPVTQITELVDPESPNGKEVLTPASRAEWRDWLASNSERREGLWVVYRKKTSAFEGPLYGDLVEEALCYGWIDSVTRRVDDDRRIQWFSPRRSGGLWSPLNKERIERLHGQGLMTEVGQAVIDRAKADGSWSQGDEVAALIIAPDLEAVFDVAPEARAAYAALPDSVKKQHLWSVYSAKRPETRAKRIADLIRSLSAR